MRAAVLGVLALLALCSAAPALGGRYRGPADQVDPDLFRPEDPPFPDSMGGPLPPDFTRERDRLRFPRPTFESWRFWWRYNEESLLDAPPPAAALDPAVVEERIVPLLDAAARGAWPHYDIQSTALLGLARLGRVERLPLLLEIARDPVGRYHMVSRQNACLALGLLGHGTPEVLAVLRARAADPVEQTGTRCNAMFALGLLGEPGAAADAETLSVLRAAVLGPQSLDAVPGSALTAIGLLRDPAVVPELLRWLGERKAGGRALTDRTLPGVASALGQVGRAAAPGGSGRDVVDALGEALRDRSPRVRWSAAIALGRIGAAGDAATAGACAALLRGAVADEAWTSREPQTAQFAIAALGRIAAGPTRTAAERDAILKTLAGVLREGAEGPRSFAALALAVGGRRLSGPPREEVAASLRKALAASIESAEAGGAAAVALGLMRDGPSVATLRTLLVSTSGDPRLRADAALALGLLGDPAAIPELRKAVEQRERGDLRHDATLALGLLRDRGAADLLIDLLEHPKTSLQHKGAAARALGWIGDAGGLDRLLAFAANEEGPDMARAVAIVAIVRLASGGNDTDLARLSEDVNYRAWYYTLGEVLTLL